MRPQRLLLLWLVLASLHFAVPVACADGEAAFRRHYDAAMRAYDAGRLQEAIRGFQQAYAIKQLPRLLLNLGQTHRRLGHAKDALGYYEFYLRVEPNPDPKLKTELDRYITQTKAMLEAAEKVRRDAGVASGDPDQADRPLALSPQESAPVTAPAADSRPPALDRGVPAPVPVSDERAPQVVVPSGQAAAVRERRPRPLWRLVTGAVVAVGGLALVGVGAWGLVVDGSCALPSCTMRGGPGSYQTQGLGIGLTVGGAVAIAGGVLLLAWPGPAQSLATN